MAPSLSHSIGLPMRSLLSQMATSVPRATCCSSVHSATSCWFSTLLRPAMNLVATPKCRVKLLWSMAVLPTM
ncbi:hypothetical protein D3C71_1820660 [compost metagenome]